MKIISPSRNQIKSRVKKFTVVGFWPDTDQRFCDLVLATNASTAEQKCLKNNPGLAICATFAKAIQPVDKQEYVLCG